MVSRAAIDALCDKRRFRKLDESVGKLRDEVISEKTDRCNRDGTVGSLTAEITLYETQLDVLRESKRVVTEQ